MNHLTYNSFTELIYLSYLHCHRIKVLKFYKFSAIGISYLNVLTRSSDWIFNPMRYDNEFMWYKIVFSLSYSCIMKPDICNKSNYSWPIQKYDLIIIFDSCIVRWQFLSILSKNTLDNLEQGTMHREVMQYIYIYKHIYIYMQYVTTQYISVKSSITSLTLNHEVFYLNQSETLL